MDKKESTDSIKNQAAEEPEQGSNQLPLAETEKERQYQDPSRLDDSELKTTQLTINTAWEEQDYGNFDDSDLKHEYDLLADAPEVLLDENDPLKNFFQPIPERPTSQVDVNTQENNDNTIYSSASEIQKLHGFDAWEYKPLDKLEGENLVGFEEGVDLISKQDSDDFGNIQQKEMNENGQEHFGEGQDISFEHDFIDGDGKSLDSSITEDFGKIQNQENDQENDRNFSSQDEITQEQEFGEIKTTLEKDNVDKKFSSLSEETNDSQLFGEVNVQSSEQEDLDKNFSEQVTDDKEQIFSEVKQNIPSSEIDKSFSEIAEEVLEEFSSSATIVQKQNQETFSEVKQISEIADDNIFSHDTDIDNQVQEPFSEVKQIDKASDENVFSEVKTKDELPENDRPFLEKDSHEKEEAFSPVNMKETDIMPNEESTEIGDVHQEDSNENEFSDQELPMENLEEPKDDDTGNLALLNPNLADEKTSADETSNVPTEPDKSEEESLTLSDPLLDEVPSQENPTEGLDDLLFANPIEEEQQRRRRPRPKKRKRFAEESNSQSDENTSNEETKAETATPNNELSDNSQNGDTENDPEKKGRRKRARRRFFTDSDEIEAFENREKKQSPLLHINSVLPLEGLGGERIKVRYIPPPPEKDKMIPFLLLLLVSLPTLFGSATTYFFFLPEQSIGYSDPHLEKKTESALAKESDENLSNHDDTDHHVPSETDKKQEEEEGMIASFRQLKINFVDGYPKTENNTIRYHLLKGKNKLLLENNDGALIDFKAALELDPQDPEALLTIAEYYRVIKDNLSALKYLEALRETHPELLITYLKIGNIFADEGRVGDARDMFNFYLVKNNIGVYAVEAKEAIKNLKGK